MSDRNLLDLKGWEDKWSAHFPTEAVVENNDGQTVTIKLSIDDFEALVDKLDTVPAPETATPEAPSAPATDAEASAPTSPEAPAAPTA